ncbi:MAG: ribonuclease G [Gammaproteobacteria bacterium]
MSSELLVNVTPQETRVAVIENGAVHEIQIERAQSLGLVGNIYKGRVCRVLPGMQAAFVEIGLPKAAFLHASGIAPSQHHHSADREMSAPTHADITAPESASAAPSVIPNISELLHEGQEILVQVIKDPLGSKGARLTGHISVPARYLVLMPAAGSVGVSQKIDDEPERARLRETVRQLAREAAASPQVAIGSSVLTDGYIVRTAAEGVSEALLSKDVEFLQRLWSRLLVRAAQAKAPAMVHEDLPLVLRTIRELSGDVVERIRIDSRETARKAIDFTRDYIPDLTAHIEHYGGERPIFDLYGVEDEIQKALGRKAQLKSGGHLVIDQTEAMTTIDVNTGAYVGHRNLEETIFKTNLEATQAIARQVRLRNLGGIIIIDFIDMDNEDHRRQVLRALERSLQKDPTKTHVSSVSALGLVQMTRKRTRESLEHVLCEPCPTCSGRGTIKSPETVCFEIFREILREARQFDAKRLLVLASPEVIEQLLDEESSGLAELEAFIGKPITLQAESLYPREQYDVVLM